MFEKAAQVGILGAIAVSVVGTFVFLTIASVVNVPGIREFDSSQLISTVVTLTAALGGAAAARFGSDSGNTGNNSGNTGSNNQ